VKTKLNKEVCKKCCEDRWYWDKNDERRWKNEGTVWCMDALEWVDKVPDECNYKFEQVVIGNKR